MLWYYELLLKYIDNEIAIPLDNNNLSSLASSGVNLYNTCNGEDATECRCERVLGLLLNICCTDSR